MDYITSYYILYKIFISILLRIGISLILIFNSSIFTLLSKSVSFFFEAIISKKPVK